MRVKHLSCYKTNKYSGKLTQKLKHSRAPPPPPDTPFVFSTEPRQFSRSISKPSLCLFQRELTDQTGVQRDGAFGKQQAGLGFKRLNRVTARLL